MTLITFQDGAVLMRDGKVGTEQACCCEQCVCPDVEQLCISITLTDYNGNVSTADQGDIFWFGDLGFVSLGNFEYTVLLGCSVSGNSGSISATVLWGGFLEECGGQCTSGGGSAGIPCSSALDWYVGTIGGPINFDNLCDPGCPEDLGSFSVTFSDPPC